MSEGPVTRVTKTAKGTWGDKGYSPTRQGGGLARVGTARPPGHPKARHLLRQSKAPAHGHDRSADKQNRQSEQGWRCTPNVPGMHKLGAVAEQQLLELGTLACTDAAPTHSGEIELLKGVSRGPKVREK